MFNLEKFIPNREQILSKNLIMGLIALIGIPMVSLAKNEKDSITILEKKIESFSPDHRKDFVKNQYLYLEEGIGKSANDDAFTTFYDVISGREIDIYADGAEEILGPQSRVFVMTKPIMSLHVDDSKGDSIGIEQAFNKKVLRELKSNIKDFFLEDSKKTNKLLYSHEKASDEFNDYFFKVAKNNPNPLAMEQPGYPEEADAEVTFIDADGDGDVDAVSMYLDDGMAPLELVYFLFDKNDKIEMYGRTIEKLNKQKVDELKKKAIEQGAIFVTNPKDREKINQKYAEVVSLLVNNPLDNEDYMPEDEEGE